MEIDLTASRSFFVARFWLLFSMFDLDLVRDDPKYEECPQCYNAGGPKACRERGIEKTDSAVLAEYGEGAYPLRWVFDKGELWYLLVLDC